MAPVSSIATFLPTLAGKKYVQYSPPVSSIAFFETRAIPLRRDNVGKMRGVDRRAGVCVMEAMILAGDRCCRTRSLYTAVVLLFVTPVARRCIVYWKRDDLMPGQGTQKTYITQSRTNEAAELDVVFMGDGDACVFMKTLLPGGGGSA